MTWQLRKSVRRAPKQLHLGSGGINIAGWCNVDIDPATNPDVVDDIKTLRKFRPHFADRIYACHVLEHLAHREVAPTLKRWHEVLKPGGELRISVPDLDRIVEQYHAHLDSFQLYGDPPWIGVLYGGQGNPFDFHRTGFNFSYLRRLLMESGFEDVAEYPHAPHFLNIADYSMANEPFGEFISLNVSCVRPTEARAD